MFKIVWREFFEIFDYTEAAARIVHDDSVNIVRTEAD